MKIKKKIFFWGGVSGRKGGASGGGVRVDVNGEVNFFVKIQKKKKIKGGGWVGVGGRGGV